MHVCILALGHGDHHQRDPLPGRVREWNDYTSRVRCAGPRILRCYGPCTPHASQQPSIALGDVRPVITSRASGALEVPTAWNDNHRVVLDQWFIPRRAISRTKDQGCAHNSMLFLAFAQHWAASLLLQLTHPEAIATHHAQSILHADSVPNSLFATPCSYVLVPYSWLPSCPRWERGPCLTLSETRPSLHVPPPTFPAPSSRPRISPRTSDSQTAQTGSSSFLFLFPSPGSL